MKITVRSKTGDFEKTVEVGKNKQLKKKDWFHFFQKGKFIETPESRELFPEQDLNNLYVADVEEGTLLVNIPVEGEKVICPFCLKENDFKTQSFCSHYLTLTVGPEALFRIGEEGKKTIVVWEGVCNLYLPKENLQKKVFDDFVLMSYKSKGSVFQNTLLIFDNRVATQFPFEDLPVEVEEEFLGKEGEQVKIKGDEKKAIVRVIYLEKGGKYRVALHPAFDTDIPRYLFSVNVFTIDREIKANPEVISEKSNPVWVFKSVGRTNSGNQQVIYATITSFFRPFVLKIPRRTGEFYRVLTNKIEEISKDEFEKEIWQKKGMMEEVKRILTELKGKINKKEKEELLNLINP